MTEENEPYRKIIECVEGGSDDEVEGKIQWYLMKAQESEVFCVECGIREQWKRGEKDGGTSNGNGGKTSKGNGGKEREGRTQNTNKVSKGSKCVSVTKKISRRRERRTQASKR